MKPAHIPPPVPTTMDHAERLAALRVGATVLRDLRPRQSMVHVEIIHGSKTRTAYAALVWPGVVRVGCPDSGVLYAQSVPGQPFELDTAATSRGGA